MLSKTRLWMIGYWVGIMGCFSGFVIAARTDGVVGGAVILTGLTISGMMRVLGKRPDKPDEKEERAEKIRRDARRIAQEN